MQSDMSAPKRREKDLEISENPAQPVKRKPRTMTKSSTRKVLIPPGDVGRLDDLLSGEEDGGMVKKGKYANIGTLMQASLCEFPRIPWRNSHSNLRKQRELGTRKTPQKLSTAHRRLANVPKIPIYPILSMTSPYL